MQRIIDLTRPIFSGMPVYPGDPDVEIEQHETLESNGWNMKRIHMNGHDGTHVNVPIHAVAGGKTLDDYDVTDFYGPCVMYETRDDIQKDVGVIFPYEPNEDMVEKLLEVRPLFVGCVEEIDELVEKRLLEHKIIVFERLVHTELLPKHFTFYGVPLRIKDGDGSPVRAFAVVE